MTVSYAAEVAQCTGFGCFPKLLLRWRASIYKLIWIDLLIYIAIYYVLNFTYRFLLNDTQKLVFESLVKYCNSCTTLIPLMFIMGFYVAIVVKRWWEQYMTLPWPDSTAVYVSTLIRGQDESGRKMRRTIMRYVCLSLTMVLTMISPRVKKRLPTLDQLVDIGLLVENELEILKSMNLKFAKYPTHWMPIVWASAIVTRARKQGRIRDDSAVKTLIDALNAFRGKCMVLTFYDTISIPLVYTQVVTIAVYTFFLASVFGRQWTGQTDTDGVFNIVDYFFPIFTMLEFLFFMGWLKVAESLICPFGEDDDDFELNWMIDRNLQVSYLIVDEMHNEHPELLKDQYWHGKYPAKRSFNQDGSQTQGNEPPLHSTYKMDETTISRSLLSVSLMESVTYLFFRKENHSGTESTIVAEKLDELAAFSESFIEPQQIKNLQDSVDDGKTKKLVNIKSNQTLVKAKSGDVHDEFEQLKQQRIQERIQRREIILTIPKEDNSEAEILTSKSSKESQSKTNSEPESQHSVIVEKENKKNI